MAVVWHPATQAIGTSFYSKQKMFEDCLHELAQQQIGTLNVKPREEEL